MRSQAPISFFRTVALTGVAALLITSAALPMPAQNSVPTAAQTAKMPPCAGRLARPSGGPAARSMATNRRNGAPQDGVIYDNGPINGTTSAWSISFGDVVSDSFTVANSSITGIRFGAWLIPGDVLESAEISITSEPNGGTSYFDQTVSFTQSRCVSNQYGSNVCTETSTSFNGPTLPAGTYWVNLQNAQVNTGDPVGWDENSGPSQAYDSSVGTIPSESFSMLGSASPTCFQSQGNLQILHDFTPQQVGTSGPAGVIIDNAGNLYGAAPNGGDNDAGYAFKLSRLSGWLLDPLFSFLGGNTGDQPVGLIMGRNGSLYGGAQGGIQNCGSDGSQYCGLVYNLRPKPTICGTALCGWNETVPYRFSSGSDGSGAIVSVSDQAGNLYGTTYTGGTYGAGTVFELSPSTGGSWTKATLYNFTGHIDGANPTQVLLGNDGDLYGVADGGGFQCRPVIFQLTPSGGQWTQRVLLAFLYGQGGDPRSLTQDSAGSLYGLANVPGDETEVGAIFTLQRNPSGWAFSEIVPQHSCLPDGIVTEGLINLTIDADGNLYGTGEGSEVGLPVGSCFWSYIFKAGYDSGGWHYDDLFFRYGIDFTNSGTLALDTGGNLYGTTFTCGTYGRGTVWQFSTSPAGLGSQAADAPVSPTRSAGSSPGR